MNTLPESILLHAQSLPEGGVLSPKEFLHLGSRAAVDQALSRLTKENKLLRVGRGTYVNPVSNRFGTRAPAPEKVIESLVAQSGETVTPHGAMAANALGPIQHPHARRCRPGWRRPSARKQLMAESYFALSREDQREVLEQARAKTDRPTHFTPHNDRRCGCTARSEQHRHGDTRSGSLV